MPYSATTSITSRTISGRRTLRIVCDETLAALADEWSVALPAGLWKMVSYRCNKTAGTAATVQPIIGRAAGFAASDPNHIATQTAAAAINDQTEVVLPLTLTAPTLVVRSQPNAGADNTLHTEIECVEGGE